MVDEELAFTPATELIEMIAAKQVSPVELTELYFDRIDRLDSQLNSYLLLTQRRGDGHREGGRGGRRTRRRAGPAARPSDIGQRHADDRGRSEPPMARSSTRTGYRRGTPPSWSASRGPAP